MAPPRGPLIYRQSIWTRLTHWTWAICLFFLLLTGFHIFNAHPALYIGAESGFDYDNSWLVIGARDGRGFLTLFGWTIDTTGFLGLTDSAQQAFPPAMTIPSSYDLASARIIHFFFAWILVVTLLVWLVASLANRHFGQLVITWGDMKALPGDIWDHLRLRFHHRADYNVLQKLAYAGVLFVLLPLMIATGLAMSPGFNAVAPWLPDLFGGRQSARSLHFVAMIGLVLFFVIHMLMILAAGPLNELRSIVTGWYRTTAEKSDA